MQYLSTRSAYLLTLLLFPLSLLAQHNDMNFYVNAALSNSPLLKDYNNQIVSTQIDSQLIRSGLKPQVNAVTNNMIAPTFNGFGYDNAITNGGLLSAMVTANKTFFGQKNLATQFQANAIAGNAIKNSQKISEQDLKRSVMAQFITAYGNQQQYFINKEINEVLSQENILFKKLTQQNVYRQADYLTFLVTYKQQELLLQQSYIQYQSDFANLNFLCGIVDTNASSIILDQPDIKLNALPDPSFSIFFNQYKLDSLKLQNDISLINYSYKPKFSVFGDAGFTSSHLYQIYKTIGFSAGFSVSVPIYDGHKKNYSIKKIKLLEDTRSNYKSFFKSQFSQQIAQLQQQLEATKSLAAAINEQVNYTEGLIKVNEQLLETGDVKVSDFIIAINNYLNARYLLTQNKVNIMQIMNQINYWIR